MEVYHRTGPEGLRRAPKTVGPEQGEAACPSGFSVRRHTVVIESLEIHLLGGFRVEVDGRPVPDDAWSRRGADLVKLLALAPGRLLHRERLVEEIWPHLEPRAGFANLHKAAHLARKAVGDPAAVVLRSGQVALAPAARVETDVERFEATHDPEHYAGELLPSDRYETWTSEPRERLRHLYREALRAARRWEELAADHPGDGKRSAP